MQAQRWGRGTAPTHVQPGIKRGRVVSTTLWPLYCHKRPGTHCTGGWVVPGLVWMAWKNSRPLWLDSHWVAIWTMPFQPSYLWYSYCTSTWIPPLRYRDWFWVPWNTEKISPIQHGKEHLNTFPLLFLILFTNIKSKANNTAKALERLCTAHIYQLGTDVNLRNRSQCEVVGRHHW